MHRLSPKVSQKIAMTLIWGGGFITVLILLVVVGYVILKGAPGLSWSFLTTPPEGGLDPGGGISTIIVSTLYLLGATIVILVPIGLAAAIYMAEYAPVNRGTQLIRYGIETLSGVPSIVFGMFGLALFVTVFSFSFSIMAGALTLVCLLLPTMIRTSEEAIKAIPQGHREAALALGATKWQMISRVVVPAALPGIITAIILCIGRSLEETACLYLTMGGSAAMPTTFMSGGRSLALHVYYLAMDANAPAQAMATGAVLIITIIIINTITNWTSNRFQKKMQGVS